MNFARLHALETRLSEEENNRIKETKIFQDNLSKLIYTLEQNNDALSLPIQKYMLGDEMITQYGKLP